MLVKHNESQNVHLCLKKQNKTTTTTKQKTYRVKQRKFFSRHVTVNAYLFDLAAAYCFLLRLSETFPLPYFPSAYNHLYNFHHPFLSLFPSVKLAPLHFTPSCFSHILFCRSTVPLLCNHHDDSSYLFSVSMLLACCYQFSDSKESLIKPHCKYFDWINLTIAYHAILFHFCSSTSCMTIFSCKTFHCMPALLSWRHHACRFLHKCFSMALRLYSFMLLFNYLRM